MKTVRPWPPNLERLTPDDVIAAGACADGVFRWLGKQGLRATQASVADLLKIASRAAAKYIKCAAGLIGYGYGYGNGYGYGDGYGNGNGYGYGYGYGDGDGNGYGDGDGDGYGYGYGNGDGYGYGDNL